MQKINAIKLINRFEQLNFLKKVVLNKNQCTMLENIDKNSIVDKPIFSKKESKKINQKEKINNLTKYLQKGSSENNLNKVDVILYNYLKPEIKNEIEKDLKGIEISL